VPSPPPRSLAVLGPLLALSVVAQVSTPLRVRLTARPSLRVVPSWRFFGPKPMVADVHLLVREHVDGDRTPARWREIPVPPQRRGRAVWNPSRFADKALHDLSNALVVSCHDLRDRAADEVVFTRAHQVLRPYLGLLTWVTEWSGPGRADERRQFALVSAERESTAADQYDVLFISREHAAA
jgi:hypothetical protein